MKSKFYFFLVLLFSFTTAMSQNKTVTGRVTSGAGEPLLGVSVSVKGTKTATATDASGDYSISVPDDEGHFRLIIPIELWKKKPTFFEKKVEEFYPGELTKEDFIPKKWLKSKNLREPDGIIAKYPVN